ncbi:putative E3 ubiquitin-protein ligase RING1a [Phalaenopsis equestris]|uniref:putative E3 ubiquitin-protein ligase RING1a n=1 Tax=Phalaenopsis equestris TaxID=78828 RepID=UPI0009E5CACB|nr:putative E3 ubiquitin-protein ligase RING1a [Phalaenopsis equestris]
MAEGGEITSPAILHKRLKRSLRSMETETNESILSPRFRSAAAMAGWDEEAILFATLVVEDTPERESSRRKRSRNQPKSSSSSSSNRKRRSRRQPVDPVPAVVLCLDDDDDDDDKGFSRQDVEMKGKRSSCLASGNEKKGEGEGEEATAKINCKQGLPYMDKLKEELSCAICLEICYEPSTTLCGHSFCKKCLKCAADKCGKKCPKCRQLISNTRSCTVNTVLWNTIQLLFPEEVEQRKKAAAVESSSRAKASSHGMELGGTQRQARSRNLHMPTSTFRSAMEVLGTEEGDRRSVRRLNPSQSVDAALALRLQREELLQAFRNSSEQQRNSFYNSTRARLRSMALGVHRMRNRS